MFVYLKPAHRRINDLAHRAFEESVESVRMGTIYAHDAKAYSRWLGRQKRPKTRMSDEAIEAAILRIGGMYPGAVERVTA